MGLKGKEEFRCVIGSLSNNICKTWFLQLRKSLNRLPEIRKMRKITLICTFAVLFLNIQYWLFLKHSRSKIGLVWQAFVTVFTDPLHGCPWDPTSSTLASFPALLGQLEHGETAPHQGKEGQVPATCGLLPALFSPQGKMRSYMKVYVRRICLQQCIILARKHPASNPALLIKTCEIYHQSTAFCSALVLVSIKPLTLLSGTLLGQVSKFCIEQSVIALLIT